MSEYLRDESARFETVEGRKVRVDKYHTEQFARDASRPGTKRALILGNVDDRWGRFWVVPVKHAERFVRAGFEWSTL